MSDDTKPKAKATNININSNNGGGGFRARLDHYLYSGDKKHVMVGLVIISAVFAVPWYFMTTGFLPSLILLFHVSSYAFPSSMFNVNLCFMFVVTSI